MFAPLVHLATTHSPGFVALAVLICVASAWLSVALVQRGRIQGRPMRLRWTLLIAATAGLGVWATHFVAMIGFRPDILFGYDLAKTAGSAFIGMALVGGPMAASVVVASWKNRALLGAGSGLGVGAMHNAGMSALEGCVLAISPLATGLSYAFGAALFALALAVRLTRNGRYLACALITLAVAAAHFVSMAGISIEGFSVIGPDAVSATTVGTIVGGVALVLVGGAVLSIVMTARLDREARLKTRLLATALHNMSNGLMMIDEHGIVRIFNDRLVELFAFKRFPNDVGMPWRDYLRAVGTQLGWSGRWTEGVIRNYERWMVADGSTSIEHVLRSGITLKITCRPIPGGGAVFTYDDVSVERSVQKQVAHMAFHDALTGLPNRRTFQNTIAAMVEAGRPVSMLMIDLDRFKRVNDTLGHAVGDELLVEVAGRLRAVCGKDFIARLGGDELAVLVDCEDAGRVDDLAARIIAALSVPVSAGEQAISVGASIGIASTAQTRDPGTLAQQADLALYGAKAAGRGRAKRYEPGMQEEVSERRLLERDLSAALLLAELTLAYQPLYSLPDRELMGFEALLRWQSPSRGAVPPAEFIPLAEETGQIAAIGEWVLNEACRQVASWPAHLHIAVNVSPVQLQSAEFLAQVTRALSISGISPGRLEIELTETALVKDGATIAATLSALRALGVRIAMDDFGTGYSSLAHLCDFELDRIKIDRSFIEAAPTDNAAMAVLRAVTQMGRDLGIPTIGEGVETETQIAMLEALGCDAVQGFRLGRPMTAAQATTLLGANQDEVVALAG